MGKYAFGVDVGGTTVKMGLFDEKGVVLDKWEIPTNKGNNGADILMEVANSIKEQIEKKKLDKHEVCGVGIGVPGPVDELGNIYKAVNLGWETFNIPLEVQKFLDFPVKAGNDANVAAFGEMWQGSGKGCRNVVAVTLGTGVGGGIVVNGNIVAGAGGAGGEIGHMHIEDVEKEACNCGNKGCLEQYTSATGIVRLAHKILAEDDRESVLRSKYISAKAVFDAVKQGDAVAIEVAEKFGDYLGKGLAAVAAVVDPEIFVIGGGVSKAGEILMEYIQPAYKKYVFKRCQDAEFVLATLGNDAGIFGAAGLILNS